MHLHGEDHLRQVARTFDSQADAVAEFELIYGDAVRVGRAPATSAEQRSARPLADTPAMAGDTEFDPPSAKASRSFDVAMDGTLHFTITAIDEDQAHEKVHALSCTEAGVEKPLADGIHLTHITYGDAQDYDLAPSDGDPGPPPPHPTTHAETADSRNAEPITPENPVSDPASQPAPPPLSPPSPSTGHHPHR